MKDECCRKGITRRSFLQVGGISVAALMAGGPLLKSLARAAARTDRRLVIIEMAGGNDGLNTLIPHNDNRYFDARPTLAIRNGLAISNEYAFHPKLASMKRLYDAGRVAAIRGPGLIHPDALSHFFMFAALRSGHIGGFTQTPGQTGWPGRIVDSLAGSDDLIAGLTLSSSVNPAMTTLSEKSASAVSTEDGMLVVPEGFNERFIAAQRRMSLFDPTDGANRRTAKKGLEGFLSLSEFLTAIHPSRAQYPETETARLMAFAARILASSDKIPVLWLNANGIFDTHSGQAAYMQSNLEELDGAIGAFFREMETISLPAGGTLADKTVVAVIAEFGRSLSENASGGTDHGKANVHFVIGKPVRGGLYGEPPSLVADEDGSLVPTMSLFDLPYTLAAWMGADPGEIIPSGGRLIDGLFTS